MQQRLLTLTGKLQPHIMPLRRKKGVKKRVPIRVHRGGRGIPLKQFFLPPLERCWQTKERKRKIWLRNDAFPPPKWRAFTYTFLSPPGDFDRAHVLISPLNCVPVRKQNKKNCRTLKKPHVPSTVLFPQFSAFVQTPPSSTMQTNAYKYRTYSRKGTIKLHYIHVIHTYARSNILWGVGEKVKENN